MKNGVAEGVASDPHDTNARSEFGCSTFKHDEDEVVVVSGGRGAENKAEILFISTGDWMPRKYLLSLGRAV